MQRKFPKPQFGLELAVAERIVPPRREEGIDPAGNAQGLKVRLEIARGLRGLFRHLGIGALGREVEPLHRLTVVLQDVVGQPSFSITSKSSGSFSCAIVRYLSASF